MLSNEQIEELIAEQDIYIEDLCESYNLAEYMSDIGYPEEDTLDDLMWQDFRERAQDLKK